MLLDTVCLYMCALQLLVINELGGCSKIVDAVTGYSTFYYRWWWVASHLSVKLDRGLTEKYDFLCLVFIIITKSVIPVWLMELMGGDG